MLKDQFGRVHDYLRISLIDKCNLRCTYCMPEFVNFLPQNQLMSADEIQQMAQLFVDHYGINKIRITGGEPLIRPEAHEIIEKLGTLPVKLFITTNGILLDRFLDLFERTGLTSINLSLDTLDANKFLEITKRDEFAKVKANMDLALARGFQIKLNVVVMNGVNDLEIHDFVALTDRPNLHVRFIEFMPFDGNQWQWKKVYAFKDMIAGIESKYDIEKLKDKPSSTSKAFRVKNFPGTFAVISSITAPFCSGCNRIRLTAEGKLRNCLFTKDETDLLSALRAGEDVLSLINDSIFRKAEKLGGLPEFQDSEALTKSLSERSMVKIGG